MLMTEPQQWGMNQSSQQFHQQKTRERYVSFLLGNITWPRLVWVVPNHDLSGRYPHDYNLSGWYPHDHNLSGPWPRLVRVVPMWPQLVWVAPSHDLSGSYPQFVWVVPTWWLVGVAPTWPQLVWHVTMTCLGISLSGAYISKKEKKRVHIQVNNWSGECALISQIIITIMHKQKNKIKS